MMYFKIDKGKRCDKIENKKVESFWEKLEKARKSFIEKGQTAGRFTTTLVIGHFELKWKGKAVDA